ncbi:hypothetical protein [Vibrio makurazakiensis]|uniref:hypothetical protein n=1 Tax=Vibrio makurazakiensis TaxID=2910250 RepID=UPI003D0C5DFC
MKNKEIAPDEITCPLCQHDEYLISESGEKFTCASCGFHTKQFSSINRGVIPSIAPNSKSMLLAANGVCH